MPPATRKKVGIAVSVGLIGAILSLVPELVILEELTGLDWLYRLRGPIAPPDDVVVVSIDEDSAAALGLSPYLDQWPRSTQATVVRNLTAAGAAIIVFDIYFESAGDAAGDRAFAEAIREAGNVLLVERLRSDSFPQKDTGSVFELEQRARLLPVIANEALSQAPFPLPNVNNVTQFWTFGRGPSDQLTLPTAALHAYALPVHDVLLQLIEQLRPGSTADVPRRAQIPGIEPLAGAGARIRRLFLADDQLFRELQSLIGDLRTDGLLVLDEPQSRLLDALLNVYGRDNSRFIRFYGGHRTIATIPYNQVHDGNLADNSLQGKVVFVGFAEDQASQQQDYFRTAFSERDGRNLSGVEIGATAFANLLHRDFTQPLGPLAQFALILIWGLVISLAVLLLPTGFALAGVAAATIGYATVAVNFFSSSGIWLPISTPLLLQLPLALIGLFAWQHADARAHTKQVRKALLAYLPPTVIDDLARKTLHTPASARLLHGICLVTDAHNYTALAERLRPDDLYAFLNDYYGVLFPEVEQRGGFVADVVGDSMVAVWASANPDAQARANACRAALAILQAVNQFNDEHPESSLPTRIGIHSGEVLLGTVGTRSHYEYRAVGDIVNTATRIEELNKRLDTSLLVSEDVLAETDAKFFRRLGSFCLAGKEIAIPLCDHVTFGRPSDESVREMVRQFDAALAAFQTGQWAEAARLFDQLLERHPTDGPSRFYRRLCSEYPDKVSVQTWDGTVQMSLNP